MLGTLKKIRELFTNDIIRIKYDEEGYKIKSWKNKKIIIK